jgi:hypothetical protein
VLLLYDVGVLGVMGGEGIIEEVTDIVASDLLSSSGS